MKPSHLVDLDARIRHCADAHGRSSDERGYADHYSERDDEADRHAESLTDAPYASHCRRADLRRSRRILRGMLTFFAEAHQCHLIESFESLRSCSRFSSAS